MAPKKLTEADKTSILSLYRQPQETTSTLAERYGVSNSTISRLLKASLPEAEYSVLIQQKRGTPEKPANGIEKPATEDAISVPAESASPMPKTRGRGRKKVEVAPTEIDPAAALATDQPTASPTASETEGSSSGELPSPAIEAATPAIAKPARRRRTQRDSPPDSPATDSPVADPPVAADPTPEPTQLTLPNPEPVAPPAKPARPVLKSAQASAPETLEAETDLGNDDNDSDDGDDWDSPVLGDDYDDDDGDDGDDEGENIYPWDGVDSPTERLHHHGGRTATETLEISPLTADVLPSLCYVVVERTSSELVVLPLRTFSELGHIPESEVESQTLPVFENHNVARRFSRRNQRVVKVPDGTLLQTTSAYLQAKGITRLFIDGQVFSLDSDAAEPLVGVADE